MYPADGELGIRAVTDIATLAQGGGVGQGMRVRRGCVMAPEAGS